MPTLREKITKQLERGRFTDNNGKVTRKMAAKTGATIGAVSAMLSKMAADGEIERQSDSRGTYAVWLTPAGLNGSGDLIEGIINAVAKLKTENEQLRSELEIVTAEQQRLEQVVAQTIKERDRARAESEQKQLEIAKLGRELDAAQRDATRSDRASDQLAKLRAMLEE